MRRQLSCYRQGRRYEARAGIRGSDYGGYAPDVLAMNDVYAGDDGLPAGIDASHPVNSFTLVVIADANPDVLLRAATQLLLSNTAPYRVLMTRASDACVRIEATLSGVAPATAESIRRKLLQLSCTESVQLRWDDAGVR
jgi:hypothetical protein